MRFLEVFQAFSIQQNQYVDSFACYFSSLVAQTLLSCYGILLLKSTLNIAKNSKNSLGQCYSNFRPTVLTGRTPRQYLSTQLINLTERGCLTWRRFPKAPRGCVARVCHFSNIINCGIGPYKNDDRDVNRKYEVFRFCSSVLDSLISKSPVDTFYF